MHPPVDPLDELLNRLPRAPEPPAHLASTIRQRLAAPPRATAPDWLTRLDVVFARPSFAAAFIAACVLLGLFLAEARLSRWHAARGTAMARSYVQLIDPLLGSASPVAPTAAPSL
jgi:hypothetical protein